MNYDIFIEGKEINLISLNEELARNSKWYQWFNDEKITAFMQKHYFPNTASLQLDYFKSSIESNATRVQCGILHKKDNILIGTIALNSIDFINRNTELSGLIGERKYQNLNYFVEANRLMLRHAFDTLNLNRVYGGSAIYEVDNLFCRVLGYTREGVLRNHIYKNGSYLDTYLFGILKEEYVALKTKWFN